MTAWEGPPRIDRIHVVETDFATGRIQEVYDWPILARSKPYERSVRRRKGNLVLPLVCLASAFVAVWGGIKIGAWIGAQPLQATVWIIVLSFLGAVVSGGWLLCTWRKK